MRTDMAKVIVERPRKKGCAWNKPKGYGRRLRRYEDEGPPRCEGIKARWQGGTKYLNEHLGPLRRYLDSQVGRPWGKVFAEICADINRDSAVQDHVRDHVAQYVCVHVFLTDGVPCSADGDGSYGRPLHQMWWPRWYVCPRTGLLRKVRPPKKPQTENRKKPNPPRFVRVNDTLQCRFLEDGWYLVTLKPLPDFNRGKCKGRDILFDRPVAEITVAQARQFYGATVYAVAKRRLARRELRLYPVPVEFWN